MVMGLLLKDVSSGMRTTALAYLAISISILIIKDKGVMTSQPPLRVRISGTTVDRRTKFGQVFRHT